MVNYQKNNNRDWRDMKTTVYEKDTQRHISSLLVPDNDSKPQEDSGKLHINLQEAAIGKEGRTKYSKQTRKLYSVEQVT